MIGRNVVNNNYVDITFKEKELDVVNVNKFIDELTKKWFPKKIEVRIEREPVRYSIVRKSQ